MRTLRIVRGLCWCSSGVPSPGASGPKNQHIQQKQYWNKFNKDIAQLVKNLPTVQETQVRPLGQEDALEEGMAIHSSILALRIPWTEEPGRLQSMGSQELDMTLKWSPSKKKTNTKTIWREIDIAGE